MATVSVTPSDPKTGVPVSVVGSGFTPAATVTFTVVELGLQSEVVADGAGYAGSDDVANHAVATLTSDATNVDPDDEVVIGTVTYKFVASPTDPNDVDIGADAAGSLANLKKAVNASGVAGTDYGTGTVANPDVTALTLTATTLLLYAKVGGTGGNSLASTETSDHLSFGGTVFASGSASTGVSAFILDFEEPGTYTIRASDGTNSGETKVQVWEG